MTKLRTKNHERKSNMDKVVIDAQALFYLQRKTIPPILKDLRQAILDGRVVVIIPTIAIAELLWKMRKWGRVEEFQKALQTWKDSPNITIDGFDVEIVEKMIENPINTELHNEIIAMTCKKYKTRVIYSKDQAFETNFGLVLRKW